MKNRHIYIFGRRRIDQLEEYVDELQWQIECYKDELRKKEIVIDRYHEQLNEILKKMRDGEQH